jgi:hypothetical protein
MSLKKVIREMNEMEKIFTGRSRYSLRYLTMGDAWKIFNYIDEELSPEWLYQDGELSRKKAEKRESILNQAIMDLESRGYRKPTLKNNNTMDFFSKKTFDKVFNN